MTTKADEYNKSIGEKKTVDQWRAEGYKPGQATPSGGWIPWRYEDINPKDRVEFIPQLVHSLLLPGLKGPHGNAVMKVDINDLACLFEVGVVNDVARFFYNGYKNSLDGEIELENFKNGGRESAPWDREHWMYRPYAPTFGIDSEGRSVQGSQHYELDQDGIPVVFKNKKLLAALWFEGALDLTITRKELLELIVIVYKTRIKRFFGKIFKRGKYGTKI